jgi:hypothetical protein
MSNEGEVEVRLAELRDLLRPIGSHLDHLWNSRRRHWRERSDFWRIIDIVSSLP